jgi:O-antigen/teichoic acid export membrane protein
MVGFKLIDRSLGLLSTLILARLLVPEDFGIVALATTFVVFLELCTSLSFDVALIQDQRADRSTYDSAWTLNACFGMAVGAFMVLLASPAAWFFSVPDLEVVMYALAIGPVVSGFDNIGVVAFQKEMRFDREFRFLFAKRLTAFVFTVTAAVILESYWALVIGTVLSRVMGNAFSYMLHPFRPRFSLVAARRLIRFSAWVLVVNVLHFFKLRSSDLVLGRLHGPETVGLFSISYEISNLAATELVAPINRAVFPAYSKLASDKPALRTEYLSVMGLIVLIAVPAVAGVAATAPLIVPALLGQNWLAATPILTILSFYGITQVTTSNAHAVYMATGRPDIAAKLGAAHVAALLAALIPLAYLYGAEGAAYAFLVASIVIVPANFVVVMNLLSIRVMQLVAELWRPLVAATVMFLLVRMGLGELPEPAGSLSAFGMLAIVSVAGAFAFVVIQALLWMASGAPEGAERIALRRITALFPRANAR